MGIEIEPYRPKALTLARTREQRQQLHASLSASGWKGDAKELLVIEGELRYLTPLGWDFATQAHHDIYGMGWRSLGVREFERCAKLLARSRGEEQYDKIASMGLNTATAIEGECGQTALRIIESAGTLPKREDFWRAYVRACFTDDCPKAFYGFVEEKAKWSDGFLQKYRIDHTPYMLTFVELEARRDRKGAFDL